MKKPRSPSLNEKLDVAIEDRRFARAMERMYQEDLANAAEIVLDARRRVCSTGEPADQVLAGLGTSAVCGPAKNRKGYHEV